MISIRSLHKYFNKNKSSEIHVINDISLELPEKGMVAIFGKSGCGKTTLLNAIGGLDKTASGSILIDGKSIASDTDTVRNQYIGYIFQNYNLNKSETCFDNVADALRLCGVTDNEVIEKRVLAALRNVDMEQYKKRTPDTLSGGQQQRIAIARAIVKNPRIILADEPTGNLDELNTVMIMDLLKQISRDHLVLLVTHEASLVDYYCDKVIELSDGKVVNVRENESAEGYNAKNKNHIYLGELERADTQNENVRIEYYGEKPGSPIDLRIVNHGGKLYVEINTPKVQILDASSEVKLKEGVFEHKQAQSGDKKIDMSDLPPFEGKNFGKLFGFRSSVISGYTSCLSKKKKLNNIMRLTLVLFSVVLVFMCSSLGTAFGKLDEIRSSYNQNLFYVYSPADSDVSHVLFDATGTNGIDYTTTQKYYPYREDTFFFRPISFETVDIYSRLTTNAVIVGDDLLKGLPILAGRVDGLGENDVVLTSAAADKLLKSSSFEYIDEYGDLIGLKNDDGLVITGIVQSGDHLIFKDERLVAKEIFSQFGHKVTSNALFPLEIEKGNVTLVLSYGDGIYPDYPKKNEKIMINGDEYLVSEVIGFYNNYGDYLRKQGYCLDYEYFHENDYFSFLDKEMQKSYPELKYGSDEYFTQRMELYGKMYEQYIDSFGEYEVPFELEFYISSLIVKENKGIIFGGDEYWEKLDKYLNTRYFEFLEKHYSKLDEFVRLYHLVSPRTETYLAYEKGSLEHKLNLASNGYEMPYYNALKALEKGEELPPLSYEDLHDFYYNLDTAYAGVNYHAEYNFGSAFYVMDAQDYIDASKKQGATHKSVNDFYNEYTESFSDEPIGYTVIHSSDPKATEKYLSEQFTYHVTGFEEKGYLSVITPDSLFASHFEDMSIEIISNLISMAALLAVMSFCMYFIMRSVLMGKIKEIGIYRAIGVSKKNLMFRFVTESLVLTTLTVFIGYALTSGLMFYWIDSSPTMSMIFYYPPWLAAILLAFIYAVCIFCGTMPVASLLRKTPSEILAKYDI
ncbi:MAG: ABC transporter ATP-binding protein/permease [Clostridia bacterium]|nr:ABC transporter ATP-binding protein/permease [Clostridia bacterium]